MPVGFLATPGASADCRSAAAPTGGLEAGFLLADRACDADGAPAEAAEAGAEAAVPSKSNRREKRGIGLHIYRQQHVIGNAFEKVERWRGTAAHYCKRPSSFVAAVQIRCFTLWLKIL